MLSVKTGTIFEDSPIALDKWLRVVIEAKVDYDHKTATVKYDAEKKIPQPL
jgi:hypothetical protein